MLLKASMIVHRIEDTLLIDNYDVDNNLITMRDDRAWLNNIFNSHNLESSDLKVSILILDCYVFLLHINYNLYLNSNLFI